jgi:hypothetical protein
MTDPLHDPRFPDRPSHPDFWRLVSVVNQIDGAATEGGKSVEEIYADIADLPSVLYMAEQRGLRIGVDRVPAQILWLDAFAAGVRFTQAGGHRS